MPELEPGPEQDLALLVKAADRAGKIALQYWGRKPKVTEKPDGQGPVTDADLAVNAMLEQTLRSARPGYGWLSEESPDDPARLKCEYTFIIDPIDGTRAFIEADRSFSHSLAIARNGFVTAAVVYLPAKSRLYAASANTPARCDGNLIRPGTRAEPDGATMLTAKGYLAPDHWIGPPPAVTRVFRASLAHRMCLVADGQFDSLLSLRPTWEWDIAAGSLIALQAGAQVSDRLGQPLCFNRASPLADGLLVANPALHAAIARRLKQ